MWWLFSDVNETLGRVKWSHRLVISSHKCPFIHWVLSSPHFWHLETHLFPCQQLPSCAAWCPESENHSFIHLVLGFFIVSGSRRNPIPVIPSWPEAEVSYFLNTEVFPKLRRIQSSEQLTKNEDSWAPTQKSWFSRTAWESIFLTSSSTNVKALPWTRPVVWEPLA